MTPQAAVKFYLANQEAIDISSLLRSFALHNPDGFIKFVSDMTKKPVNHVGAALVKLHPDTFIHYASEHVGKLDAAREIIHTMLQPQVQTQPSTKIKAIKLMRETWNLGLKEAKDIADHVHHALFVAGRRPDDHTPGTPFTKMDSACQGIFKLLSKFI